MTDALPNLFSPVPAPRRGPQCSRPAHTPTPSQFEESTMPSPTRPDPRSAVQVSSRPFGSLTCPVCGAGVKWDCLPSASDTGQIHCQNGRMVSRRLPGGTTKPCRWAGTSCYRVADGSVWSLRPWPTTMFPE